MSARDNFRKYIAGMPADDVNPLLVLQERFGSQLNQKFICTGIHITTLNAFLDKSLEAKTLMISDLIYADGISVAWLMKISRFKSFKRVSTTDLLSNFLDSLSDEIKLRVAILGGEELEAKGASISWAALRPADSIWWHHGFEANWEATLNSLSIFKPDLVLIGMGMPLEIKFIEEHLHQLPNSIYVTCGGLIRILAGVEKRSPRFIQILRCEWLFRMFTNPSRTLKRYSIGVVTLIRMSIKVLNGSLK